MYGAPYLNCFCQTRVPSRYKVALLGFTLNRTIYIYIYNLEQGTGAGNQATQPQKKTQLWSEAMLWFCLAKLSPFLFYALEHPSCKRKRFKFHALWNPNIQVSYSAHLTNQWDFQGPPILGPLSHTIPIPLP